MVYDVKYRISGSRAVAIWYNRPTRSNQLKEARMIRRVLAALLLLLPLSGAGGDGYKWGVGIQGNYPLWGGVSVKYMGFHPIDLVFVGRAYLYKKGSDCSLVGAVSYTLLETEHTRTYLMIGGGTRRQTEEWVEMAYPTVEIGSSGPPPKPVEITQAHKLYSVLGGGVVLGNEFILFSRYGINFEFGQGFGRVRDVIDYEDEKAAAEAGLEEKDESWLQSSFVFGFGFHVYF